MKDLIKEIWGRKLSREEIREAEKGSEEELPLEMPLRRPPVLRAEILYVKDGNIVRKVGEYLRRGSNWYSNTSREISIYDLQGNIMEKEFHVFSSKKGWKHKKVVYEPAGSFRGRELSLDYMKN